MQHECAPLTMRFSWNAEYSQLMASDSLQMAVISTATLGNVSTTVKPEFVLGQNLSNCKIQTATIFEDHFIEGYLKNNHVLIQLQANCHVMVILI
jgi:hypothetical protein